MSTASPPFFLPSTGRVRAICGQLNSDERTFDYQKSFIVDRKNFIKDDIISDAAFCSKHSTSLSRYAPSTPTSNTSISFYGRFFAFHPSIYLSTFSLSLSPSSPLSSLLEERLRYIKRYTREFSIIHVATGFSLLQRTLRACLQNIGISY